MQSASSTSSARHGAASTAGVLAGRCALVTGASSGIGRSIAEAFAAAGAAVAVNDVDRPEEVDRVVRAIEASGGRAVAAPGDVSKEADVVAMVARTADMLGPLDILVSNAGVQKDAPFVDLSLPYGRVGVPADVARAAVWLASDASDYVTGATLYVDGGMTLYPEFRTGG